MNAKPRAPRRPSLGEDCRCGHTYNWHVPGGVCQVPNCVCKKHITREPDTESEARSVRPVIEHALTAYGYSPDTARTLIDRLLAEKAGG